MGTGELRTIASRVAWMCLPVDRSMTVSAPQRVAQVSFATSSSTEDVTAEVPMFALTFTRNRLPISIGSLSGWFTLFGRIARPAAISARTTSGSTPSRIAANSISGVTTPCRAKYSWVTPGPGRSAIHPSRTRGGCPPGPDVSYSRTGGSPPDRSTSANGTRTSGREPVT